MIHVITRPLSKNLETDSLALLAVSMYFESSKWWSVIFENLSRANNEMNFIWNTYMYHKSPAFSWKWMKTLSSEKVQCPWYKLEKSIRTLGIMHKMNLPNRCSQILSQNLCFPANRRKLSQNWIRQNICCALWLK